MAIKDKLAQLPDLLLLADSTDLGPMPEHALARLCYVQAAQIEALQRAVRRLMEDKGATYLVHSLYNLREPTGTSPVRRVSKHPSTLLDDYTPPRPKARPDFDALVRKVVGKPDPNDEYDSDEHDRLASVDDDSDSIGDFVPTELKLKKPAEDPRDHKSRLRHMAASSDYARKLREDKEKGSK